MAAGCPCKVCALRCVRRHGQAAEVGAVRTEHRHVGADFTRAGMATLVAVTRARRIGGRAGSCAGAPSRASVRIPVSASSQSRACSPVLLGHHDSDRRQRARAGYRADRDVRGRTSVLSERHHRADPGRAPRGHGTACSSDADKDHDRERHRREIVRIDAEE